MKSFSKVLVFAAHPDDEVIGCGGFIRKLVNAGAQVTVVVVTGGQTGISPAFQHIDDIATERKLESEATQSILGFQKLFFLPYKTQEVKNDRETFHSFIKLIREEKPDLVLTHAEHDKHRDHQAVSIISKEAVWKAWENVMPQLGERHRVGETWYYEVTDPFQQVDVLVDISSEMDAKLKAIRAHHTQQEVIPRIEGLIEGLGKTRAFILETLYAEGYQVCSILPRVIDNQ
ncbi:MAG: PIG-L family deacetylase [Anaerolineales bacterium]|nr:MAG: PIG-L family deacetylase [Anaerolineales bacterium]